MSFFQIIIGLIVIVIALYYIVKSPKEKSFEFIGLGKNPKIYIPLPDKKEGGTSQGEEISRSIFEKIFYSKFNKCRPAFLKNPVTGKNLELDGFCPTIRTPIGRGIAFEYDGCQHSNYIPFFHKSQQNFAYQIKKDSFKDRICKEKGIVLIRIPYFIAPTKIENYIKAQCKKNHLI